MPSVTTSPKQPPLVRQGLLLLLPVLVLAVIGSVSLLRERRVAMQEAREEMRRATTDIAGAIGPGLGLFERLPVPDVPLLLDASGALVSPPPYPALPVPGEGSESGLPPGLLEALHQQPQDGAAVVKAAIAYPSILTPTLLENFGSGNFDSDLWHRHEAARATYAKIAGRLMNLPAQPFWDGPEAGTGDLFCLIPAPPETDASWSVVHFGQGAIASALEDLLAQDLIRARIPTYALPITSIEGLRLSGREDLSSTTIPVNVSWLPGGTGHFTFGLALHDPDQIGRAFARRALWLGGLIAAAALAAVFGFIHTRRAFLQQQRLHAEKDNFVSSVTHELRAPVASMQIMAESLATDRVSSSGKRHEYYGLIRDECRRLGSLVENVLDFSRLESGRKEFDLEDTDLGALAIATAKIMTPQAAQRSILIETDLSPASAPTDPSAIQRALINLIENALAHTPAGGTVTLGCSPGKLWVADTGPGIPESEHAKIFERFYRRGSELTRENRGVGIGLSIVKSIALAHGGSVSLESAPGQGSCFTLHLP